MAYATDEEVSDYSGIAVSDLPTDVARLIDRAGELIDEAALNRIDEDDADHLEAAKLATCAQVHEWIAGGEDRDLTGPVRSYQIGSLRIEHGAGQAGGNTSVLSSRARRHLLLAGLLYRGVRS